MPGSPKKRAKREAAEREKNMQPASAETVAPQVGEKTEPAPSPPALQGEILPPAGQEPTRTAQKRAMRVRAQEHAEEAIGVLVANMRNEKLAADKRESAAQKLLEWGFGKPGLELGDADGGLLVTIQKFVREET